MREIKFRAWDKKNEKWTINIVLSPEGVPVGQWGDSLTDIDPENVDIVFCTGLKDKNGKEVFESDIVKAGIYGESYVCEIGWGGPLNHAGFGYTGKRKKEKGEKWKSDIFWDDLKLNDSEKIEIIGNKFENPELLEVVNERTT